MDIFVATDLWGVKDNIRLFFLHPPSLSEFYVRAEHVYDHEMRVRRPADVRSEDIRPFKIACATILTDDVASSWATLSDAQQLYHRCQVYVFQPRGLHHSDERELIPYPREVNELPLPPTRTTFTPPVSAGTSPRQEASRSPVRGSPRRETVIPSPLPAASPLDPLELAHTTFRLLAGVSEVIRIVELKATLITIGLDVSRWDHSDLLRDGKKTMTFREWLSFCERYPNIAALIAQRVAGTEPSGVIAKTASPDRRVRRDVTANAKELSPVRTPMSNGERQQRVAERLSCGLSSIVTQKDRERGEGCEHATHLLPASPGLAQRQRTPTRVGTRTTSPRTGRSTPRHVHPLGADYR